METSNKWRTWAFSFVKEPQGFSVIWNMAKCNDTYPIEDFKEIEVIEIGAVIELESDVADLVFAKTEAEKELDRLRAENDKLSKLLEQSRSKHERTLKERNDSFVENERLKRAWDTVDALNHKVGTLQEENAKLRAALEVCRDEIMGCGAHRTTYAIDQAAEALGLALTKEDGDGDL